MSQRAPGAVHSEVTQLSPRSGAVARGCAGLALIIGVGVLVGWCCHSRPVERILSGLPVMTAWTAIGLSLGAAGLLGLSARRGRGLGRLLGAAMALLGMLVIWEYLVGPIGMDQWLFRASGATDPGRPSPQTAVCLLLLGSALASLGLPGRGRRCHLVLLAGTAVVVVFVTVGYLFGIVELRGVSGSNGVALHTLVGVVVLSVGIAALSPDGPRLGGVRGRGSCALVARALALFGLAPVIVGAGLFALLRSGVLGPRAALTLFTVAMIVALVCVALPLIAQVRRAEAGTRELAGRLQALFDNAPAALSLRDTDGCYLHINRYGAEIVGQSPEALVGQRPTRTWANAGVTDDDAAIARTGQSVAHDRVIQRADGTLADFHVVRYPVMENGEVRAFGTFGVDITEHKRTMFELELAQARFRSAFAEAPIGMMVQGLDGEVQEVNPALCALVGRDAAALLSVGAAAFIAEEDRIVEATARAELIGGPARSHTLELSYETVSAQRIPVDVHLTLVRAPDGAPSHFIAQVQDVTERRRHEQELEFLADHDPLTDLLNRRAFLRQLGRHQRHRDEAGAVIIFDLDALKAVNDAHGHQAGDELIIRTAAISRSQLRGTDVIARLGGDEFAVLLPGTSPETATDVAHTLLGALNARTDAAGLPVRPIRASLGVTAFSAPLTESSAMILQRADFAMYEAKRDGGNRVRVAPATADAGQRAWA